MLVIKKYYFNKKLFLNTAGPNTDDGRDIILVPFRHYAHSCLSRHVFILRLPDSNLKEKYLLLEISWKIKFYWRKPG